MATFIQSRDYSVLIADEQLSQITTNQIDIDTCLLQSEEEVKEYLRHRFDVEFDMRGITTLADGSSVTAQEKDRIFISSSSKYYVCIQDASGEDITNTTYFEEKDDRNHKLVQITIDVFLYHLHTRLNPRNVPQHRKIRYDGDGDIDKAMSATKWLLMVQKGTITPALTPIIDDNGDQLETGQSIIYGSTPNPNKVSTQRNEFLTGN